MFVLRLSLLPYLNFLSLAIGETDKPTEIKEMLSAVAAQDVEGRNTIVDKLEGLKDIKTSWMK